MVIETVLGVAMALVMHQAFQGRGIVRASILVPWAIPTVVSALLWRWIFQADGIANAILGTQILWTTEGFQAKLAVIIADTWKTAPFIGLLVLAGLQMIPAEVYEAAKVDGATAWQPFWRITLPLVKPALLVAVLFRILDTLRMFDLPYVLIGPQKPSRWRRCRSSSYLENSQHPVRPGGGVRDRPVPLRRGRRVRCSSSCWAPTCIGDARAQDDEGRRRRRERSPRRRRRHEQPPVDATKRRRREHRCRRRSRRCPGRSPTA